jgi:hypothetical protein
MVVGHDDEVARCLGGVELIVLKCNAQLQRRAQRSLHALRAWRRTHAVRCAHKKVILEHMPQTREGMAHGRLAHPEPLTGSRKRPLLHDCIEDSQQI